MAAILFVDLDRFKLVNDLYGHGVGDELLIAVSRRLSAIARPGDTLARMSGDEFVVLCEDLQGSTPAEVRQQVDAIAARIAAEIAAPFVLADAEILMTASVGIAFAGRGAQISEQVLHDADTAMYQAKREGGARHQIIDLREQHLADVRANLEHDLRGASTRGELRTEYQPIVETTSGTVVGVEALVRWAHPSRGLVAPAVLVPLAEQLGLITDDRTLGAGADLCRRAELAVQSRHQRALHGAQHVGQRVCTSADVTLVRADPSRRCCPTPAPTPRCSRSR
jgi:diguanylate cyclase (GGDEF)-like protein